MLSHFHREAVKASPYNIPVSLNLSSVGGKEANMAASESKPAPKRRRILDPSAIVPVPVYSNKVSSSLQMKPTAALLTEKDNTDDDADNFHWSSFSRGSVLTSVHKLSDSEDEVEVDKPEQTNLREAPASRPSPPPPDSPLQKRSRKVQRKISEIDRKLQAVNSLLSPECSGRSTRTRRGAPSARPVDEDDDIIVVTPGPQRDDDDIIFVSPGPQSSPYNSPVREIPLKVRCRTDIHKIPVQSSTPLSVVVKQLSVILKVPPPRLLLLREDAELSTDATIGELGLNIADIIDCVVVSSEDQSVSSEGSITVRLQSKNKDSSQHFSIHRKAPLGSVFSQFLAQLPPTAQKTVRFFFDGSKVSEQDTPAALDMEDGDIIEVWT